MVSGPSVFGEIRAETELLQVERVDKGIDQAHLVVGGDQLIQAGTPAGRLIAAAGVYELHGRKEMVNSCLVFSLHESCSKQQVFRQSDVGGHCKYRIHKFRTLFMKIKK